MRVVIQRVSSASVHVEDSIVASIERGLLLLAGVAVGDGPADVDAVAAKVASLRLFPDEQGRMNRSLPDVGGEILLVSQFTLLGNMRKGRRPSFTEAASPKIAEGLVSALVEGLRKQGLSVSEGVFGAKMTVELVNDGPVTLVLDAADGLIR